MNKEKCLVVLSGGQDSTTCLMLAITMYKEVEAITFNYGQRHAKEIECATDICNKLQVKQTILDMALLNALAPNALTRASIEVKAGEEGELPNTFVDGRNMLFLTFAAVVAKQKGISDIMTGVCQTDFSGYPDCRDTFIKSLNVTLNLAMDYDFQILTPLMWMNKSETWELADQLGCYDIILSDTLTCYNGIRGEGCGKCPACQLRQAGLENYLDSKVKLEEENSQ